MTNGWGVGVLLTMGSMEIGSMVADDRRSTSLGDHLYPMLTTAWVLAALTVLVTAASLWNYKVWWVRMFDLPRGQVILLGVLAIVFFISDGAISSATGWAIAFTALAIAYQARKVFPYTFLAPVMACPFPTCHRCQGA